MSLDARIISLVVRKPELLVELQRSGITSEHFVGEYPKLWQFLTRMKDEHDAVPSGDIVEERFKFFLMETAVKKRDLPSLVHDIYQRKKYIDFMTAIDRASIEADSPEMVNYALSVLQESLNELSVKGEAKKGLVDAFSGDAKKRMVADLKERRRGGTVGIPTGLQRLDYATNGLQNGRMVTIMGRSGLGKAQPLDAKILTPDGWSTMGEMETGTLVTTPDGGTATVISTSEVSVKKIYRLFFDDGATTTASQDHLWSATSIPDRVMNRGWQIYTTDQMWKKIERKFQVPVGNFPDQPETRTLTDYKFLGNYKCKCITLDSEEQLYVTDDFIVTHNSWIDLLFVASAVMHGKKVVLFPLEMTFEETALRLYTIFSQKMFGADKVFRNTDLSSGRVSPKKMTKFLSALEDRFAGQLYVADIGSMSDPYTVQRVGAEISLYKPDMFWVDYLTLMKAPGVGRDGQEDHMTVKALSNGIKGIAMRNNCVGGISAQVNREAIKSGHFLPRIEHISFGDSIGSDSDLVVSINRKGNHLFYSLVKHRGGPEVGQTKCSFEVNDGLVQELHDQDEDDDD